MGGAKKRSKNKRPFNLKGGGGELPSKALSSPRSASLGTSWLHIWMQQRLSMQGGVEAEDPGVHAPRRARACGSVSIGVYLSVCVRARAHECRLEPRLQDRVMGLGAQEGINLCRPPRASLRVNNQPVIER